MELSVGDLSFAFQLNPTGSRYVAPITLTEWEPFRSTNTVPGREGQHVLLECPRVHDETEEGKLADRSAYLRSLEYFLNHRTAMHHNVVAACLTFVQELHAVSVKYQVERVELARVASAEDLHSLIDLSYVQLFPYHQLGLPYVGLHFECNWAEDHGLLALLVGTEVIACGYAGTARAVDSSIRDDGGVI